MGEENKKKYTEKKKTTPILGKKEKTKEANRPKEQRINHTQKKKTKYNQRNATPK